MVRRVGTQPVDPVSIPGGARHFQCVNDIGVSVYLMVMMIMVKMTTTMSENVPKYKKI